MTLEQLRAQLAELSVRADGLIAGITDDTAAEHRAQIDQEHQGVLREITETRRQITAAEDAARTITMPVTADIAAAVTTAIAGERGRVASLRQLGRQFQVADDFVERHIADGTDETGFGRAVLDHLAQHSERSAIFAHVQAGAQDEVDQRRAGMSAAIAARLARASGQRNVEVPAHARAWAERELVEIAAECVGWHGPVRTPRQVAQMFERAFHTTSDFPGIFTDAMNVTLLARYQVAAPSYRRWAARYGATDFRVQNVIRAGDFPSLQAVNEAGEIKNGTFSESKEQFIVNPYAVMLRISRQMIVNDQLGAISQVLGSAGDRVGDWENGIAYSRLAEGSGAGPVLLTDTKRVFHTDHGNLAGTAAAIGITSVGIGRASMMKQTTLDGIKANFIPATLLVGPDKLTEAEQLLTSITPAQPSNAVPEAMRRLVPVGDSNISGNAWYLFADPNAAPCFVYGYLEGFEGPRLSSEDVFDVQGMKVKLEHDFGVAAIDYRGGFRNAGA